MAGLDDLFNQIPVADIANKLGADQGEVNQAIQTLVPTLLGTLQENVQAEDIDSVHLEKTVIAEGQSDLLDGGVNVDHLDENQGNKLVASLFGGNDTNQVASALAGGGAPGGDLIKRLLPMLAPIVLAYVGRQFQQPQHLARRFLVVPADPLGKPGAGRYGIGQHILRHEAAAPLGNANQAAARQFLQRPAHGVPVDREFQRQLRFRRQPVARR